VGGPIVYGQPVAVGTPVVVGGPLPGFSPTGQPFGTIPQPDLDPPLCGPGPTGPLSTLTSSVLGPSRVAGGGPERLRLDADLLLWYVRSGRVPPLVTTSSPQYNGVIGQGDTRVLFGGDTLDRTFHTGGRFGGVYWLGCDQRWGVDGNVFFLAQRGWSEQYVTSGSPLLARPFFNVNLPGQDSVLASFPNAFVGGITAAATTNLWGGEANFLWNLYRSCPGDACHVTVNGFRFYELNEQIAVNSVSRSINGTNFFFNQQVFTTPATVRISDRFQTLNRFYGGQVGLSTDVKYGRVFWNAYGKLGLGINNQRYNVTGTSSINDPNTGANTTIRSGVLANQSNIGRFGDDQFMLVPEAGLSLGYNWTSWFTTTVGYSFLYMDNVLRPGDQFTTQANATQIPVHPTYGGAALPVANPALNRTDFWAQGVTFGFVFRW
jgi:hypothetical protein